MNLEYWENQFYDDRDNKLSDEALKEWFELIHAELFTRKAMGMMREHEDGTIVILRR